MICEKCHVMMKNGTSYDNRKGGNNRRRFSECPNCHNRRYNNSPNFQELFVESVLNK